METSPLRRIIFAVMACVELAAGIGLAAGLFVFARWAAANTIQNCEFATRGELFWGMLVAGSGLAILLDLCGDRRGWKGWY